MSDTTTNNPAGGTTGHDDHHGVGHVVPLPLLVGVLGILLFLTVVTVAVSRVDLGFLNIWVAMGVATVKALFVCAYFMHLRWDKPFNTIVLLSAIAATGLFLALAMMDTREYQPHLYSPGPDEYYSESSTEQFWRENDQYLDKLAPADAHRGATEKH